MSLAAGQTVVIREATPPDRPAMLDLWVEAWTQARPGIDFMARRGWLDARLDVIAAGGAHVLVAVIERLRPAGFATVDPVSGDMDQLVTAVWAQRQGVGRGLLRHARRLSPAQLTLTVNQFNAPAIRLYEQEGFRRTADGISPASGLKVWHMRWDGEGAL